jgi:hypothetical protein
MGMRAQKKLSYNEYVRKNEIRSRIEDLKKNYNENQSKVFDLERDLGRIIDNELKDRMMDLKIFDCLHAEKATSHFLNLAKKTSKGESLEKIRKPDGTAFETESERSEYITNFYSSLYRKDETVAGEIEEFLGPAACSHPLVTGSKLTEAEREALDAPLRIEELDVSLNKANVKSAPGVDGISYRYIIRFWHLYRKPLYECARESFELGVMPDAFRTATIRLLPKKGDISQIKNWRPISLLSNFYKIISRLINNRLKKITDRVLSRSQKGFNRSRQIQEVLINSIETMEYCKRHNIKAAMVSVDVSKAFDSVDHIFMDKVYRFYGFGDRIRKWLATIGTGRNAQIILSNDELSVAFQLEKGHAQGDSPSPLLYNMAAQICIWKIELEPGIESVYNRELRAPDPNLGADPDPMPGPNPVPVTVQVFENECNRETDKNESFADDANNFTVLKLESLKKLKEILEAFHKLSGLSCNVEKTSVMRIGNLDGEIDQEIINLGFSFVNDMVLLGFKLSNIENVEEINFLPVLEKIQNTVRFWERFYLSLPGKISIYKCLLLSQISYKASILMPPPGLLRAMEETMERFVLKGFTFARDRLYRKVKDGGLGLIRLEHYVQALHCTWIRRAWSCTNDNWKYDLYKASNGDILNVKDYDLGNEVGTVLSKIVKSYTAFQHQFTTVGNNFTKVPVFKNENFGYGRRQSIKLDSVFFGADLMDSHSQSIRKLTWDKCTVYGNIIQQRDFHAATGIPISREQYSNIKTAYASAKKKFWKDGALAMDIEEYVRSFKKGSKKFRQVLSYETKTYDITKLTQVITLARITNTTVPPESRIRNMHGTWGRHGLNNQFRVYTLKYYNNILGLNNRVAHFVPNTDTRCTFCVIENREVIGAESFEHIFYSCPSTHGILTKMFERFFTVNLSPQLYFSGEAVIGNEKENIPFNLTLDIIRFFIWQCKLNKKKPTLSSIIEEVKFSINVIRKTSEELSDLFQNCSLFKHDGGDPDDGEVRGDGGHGRG